MVNLAPLKKIKLAPPKSNQIKLAPPKSSPPRNRVGKSENSVNYPLPPSNSRNLIDYPPPSKSGRKTLSTTPLEFTKPHRLPPLEIGIGSENPLNYPPPRIHETSSTTAPPRNRAGKLHQLPPPPPLEFTAGTEIRPPLNSIPRSATGPSPPKHLGLAPPNIYT